VEQEQPDSPHINPAFIVFREKLNRMEKAGEFLEPIGPLVYAIQERQVNEIRVQVQRHNMALAPRVVEISLDQICCHPRISGSFWEH
jgi:hypothetical protein